MCRGLRTALVEREDFASGTSSKSTKLVHGGVRYLEKAVFNADYGQLKLVFEALHERKRLLQNAPHLCTALPIMTVGFFLTNFLLACMVGLRAIQSLLHASDPACTSIASQGKLFVLHMLAALLYEGHAQAWPGSILLRCCAATVLIMLLRQRMLARRRSDACPVLIM